MAHIWVATRDGVERRRMTKLDEMELYQSMDTVRAVYRRRQALQAKADQADEAQDRNAD